MKFEISVTQLLKLKHKYYICD